MTPSTCLCGERPTPSRFNTLLQAAQPTDHYETVNEVVLRSQLYTKGILRFPSISKENKALN